MCTSGYDAGDLCRFCGGALLICYDDGPTVCWHADEAQTAACLASRTAQAVT